MEFIFSISLQYHKFDPQFGKSYEAKINSAQNIFNN
jgi:hypothetical protein